MDPEYINSVDWREIGNLLHFFWFILLFAIGFGFNFLAAHAVIPSLISSGHLPQRLNKARRIFYIGALGFLTLVLFSISRIIAEAHILKSIWERWWI
jgi:hypothetical protein